MKPPPKSATVVYVQRYDIRPGRLRVAGSRRKTVGVYPAESHLPMLLLTNRLGHGPGRYRLEYRDAQRKLLAVRILNVGKEAEQYKPRSKPRGLPMKVTNLPPLDTPRPGMSSSTQARPAPTPRSNPSATAATPTLPAPHPAPPSAQPVVRKLPSWPPPEKLQDPLCWAFRGGAWVTFDTSRGLAPGETWLWSGKRYVAVPSGEYEGYELTRNRDGVPFLTSRRP